MMIRMVSYCLFCILILSCKSSLQNKIKKDLSTFQITLGDCFDNDKVSVFINNQLLFKSDNVKTDSVLGITKISLIYYKYQKKGKFLIENNRNEKYLDFFVEGILDLKIIKNDIVNSFKLDIKRGKIIIIDACENRYKNKIAINQYKKSIYLE